MNETTLGILITSVTGILTALTTAVVTAYAQITVERIKAEAGTRVESSTQRTGLVPEAQPSSKSLTLHSAFRSVNWPITILLTVLAVLIMLVLVFSLRPSPTPFNRLITCYDFEGTDDGWSGVASWEFASDGTVKSRFPQDSFFPGSMTSEVTTDYALTGHSSLKVTTSVNIAGDFKSFLFREGTLTGNGVTIYVLAPDLTHASIDYIQLCIPMREWLCSGGTQLVPGEWTPITIDLNQSDNNGISWSSQKLTELAVQWRFNTKVGTSLALYFDSVEIFYPGP